MIYFKTIFIFLVIIMFVFNNKTLALNEIIELDHKNLLDANVEALFANIIEFDLKEGKHFQDIVYKSTENEKLTLDLFLPISNKKSDNTDFPVIVYLHGGSFIRGGKKEILELKPLLTNFLENGWAVASVDYRLINKNNNFPDNIRDVNSALFWIQENAEKFSLDKNKIGLMGHSAGGNLALLGGLASEEEFYEDNSNFSTSKIDFIISFSGPTKFYDIENFELRKSIISFFSEKKFDEKIMKNASPINFIHSDSPPILLVHGTEDLFVPYEQSRLLYNKAVENKVDCKLIKLNKAGHTIRLSYLPVIEVLGNHIIKFIDEYGFGI